MSMWSNRLLYPIMLIIYVLCDQVLLFLDICSYTNQKTCIIIFIKSLIFLIAPNWKQHKCPLIIEWMKVVNSHNGILYNNEKEQAATFCNMFEFHKYHVRQQKPVTKECMLYDSNYIRF